MKVVTQNRKAFHDYEIEDTLEAGIALEGSEVKSIRAGKVSIRDSYARIKNEELWLVGMHIAQYEKTSSYAPDTRRPRKLLVHRSEIRKLRTKIEERGYTLIPLEVYINDRGLVKIKLGLAKGRRKYEKKAYLLQKQQERDKERELKEYLKRKM